MQNASAPPAVTTHLGLHVVGWVGLALATFLVWHRFSPGSAAVELWGLSGNAWLLINLAIPVLHQTYVWIAWRRELIDQWTSRTIGFEWYRRIFLVFLASRALLFLPLVIATRSSLGLPVPTRIALTLAFGLPALWTGYSVYRYFGTARACGGDHFDPEIRALPMVQEGIFRYVSNAMYACGFMGFWAGAFAFDSITGLVAAGYCHAYIWLHYFALEKPDLDYLYGSPADAGGSR